MTFRLVVLVMAILAVTGVGGCSTVSGQGGPTGRVEVVAAFYPLQYAVEQVGGSHVTVHGLTKPGAEPHDLELTPRQVGRIALADLVVYQRAFQPAVDEAVRAEAPHTALDVSPAARLDLAAPSEGGAQSAVSGTAVSGTAATGAAASADPAAPRDPHFWLDPMRFADVGDAIAARLAMVDPASSAAYRSNAQAFRATMVGLDHDYQAGLRHCASTELVTSHAAFGYLAESYGLHQDGITGLDPDAEPNPASLARISAHVRSSGASTVYAETLVSPAVARTVARETGARLAVLDPIEGITTQSAGHDYPSVMRANLATLRSGQRCS